MQILKELQDTIRELTHHKGALEGELAAETAAVAAARSATSAVRDDLAKLRYPQLVNHDNAA